VHPIDTKKLFIRKGGSRENKDDESKQVMTWSFRNPAGSHPTHVPQIAHRSPQPRRIPPNHPRTPHQASPLTVTTSTFPQLRRDTFDAPQRRVQPSAHSRNTWHNVSIVAALFSADKSDFRMRSAPIVPIIVMRFGSPVNRALRRDAYGLMEIGGA
jgi:hypothetical protein